MTGGPPWRIEVLTLHRVVVPGPEVLFQRGFDARIELAIHAFLLTSGTATLLVDSGLPADHSGLDRDIRRRKGADSGFADIGPRLVDRLAAAGVRPDAAILTSFGPYAVGGLAELPPMPLFASSRGLADLTAPEEPVLVHGVPAAAAAVLARAEGVAGQREIAPGVVFVEVGIHHPASAALLVTTAAGVVAIADPVFTAANLRDGIALGAAEHAAGWHGMIRSLGARAAAMLPIHDPDSTPVARRDWHASLRSPLDRDP